MSRTMDAAVPTKVLQGVRYGQSWMRDAVTARQAADNRTHDPLQELSSYLTSPLEETDNIVAWWGVRFSLYYHILSSLYSLATLTSVSHTISHCARLPTNSG
jgi:hypothetical protein